MTRIERCTDKKCKEYGKQYVDRGYGYPVCPSTKPSLNPRPMNLEYYGKYVDETKRILSTVSTGRF